MEIRDARAGRDLNDQIFPALAVEILPAAVAAVVGVHFAARCIVGQCIDIRNAFGIDIAAAAAVAAGRTLHEPHLAECNGALAAIASGNLQLDIID